MSINKSNVIALVIGVILGAIFFGGSGDSSEPPTPTGSESSSSTRVGYTIEMSDGSSSKAIQLRGDYQVDWEIVKGGCIGDSALVNLRSAWGEFDYYESIFSAEGEGSGVQYFYALEDGNYYLEANAGSTTNCSWKATFTPLESP